MKFCENCGKEIPAGMNHCTNCTSFANQQPVNPRVANKLHCPNCKSSNIAITTESSVTGGLTTHHGGVSSTHMSNSHRNFWICSDCGTKFRNIQNLEEEIKRSKSTPIVYTVLSIIGLIITIVLLMQISGSTFGFIMYPFLAGSSIATLVFIIFIFKSKSALSKMRAELDYLKINCFN